MEARLPDHNTCRGCHLKQVEQFLAGKHALAWDAMMAIPMTKQMPKEEVLFGCGGCHKIGIIDPQDLLDLGLTRPTEWAQPVTSAIPDTPSARR